jgi:hypothetical protein
LEDLFVMTALAVVSKAKRRYYWSDEMMDGLAAAISASVVTQNHIVATSKKSTMALLQQRAGRGPEEPRPARRAKGLGARPMLHQSRPSERDPAGNTSRQL